MPFHSYVRCSKRAPSVPCRAGNWLTPGHSPTSCPTAGEHHEPSYVARGHGCWPGSTAWRAIATRPPAIFLRLALASLWTCEAWTVEWRVHATAAQVYSQFGRTGERGIAATPGARGGAHRREPGRRTCPPRDIPDACGQGPGGSECQRRLMECAPVAAAVEENCQLLWLGVQHSAVSFGDQAGELDSIAELATWTTGSASAQQ